MAILEMPRREMVFSINAVSAGELLGKKALDYIDKTRCRLDELNGGGVQFFVREVRDFERVQEIRRGTICDADAIIRNIRGKFFFGRSHEPPRFEYGEIDGKWLDK